MGEVLFYDAWMLSFSVSRIDIVAVRSTCRVLNLVAFDRQEMLLIRVSPSYEWVAAQKIHARGRAKSAVREQ